MSLLQKLVDSPLFIVVKVNLTSVKDIFNAIAEKIEAWKDCQNPEELVILLQVGSIIVQNNIQQEKIDNVKCLYDIVQQSEDIRAIIYAAEMLQIIGNKRSIEFIDKITNIALAHNVLRTPQNHLSLLDFAKGTSKNGESLLASDFILEIDVAPQGLNERTTTQTISIPREKVLDPTKTVKDVVSEIAPQAGKQSEKFKSKIEARVLWFRFIKDEESLRQASLLHLNSISVAFFYKTEFRSKRFISYLKDHFIKQSIELLSQSGDKVLLTRLLQNMYKIFQRDHSSQISLELLIKVNSESQEEQDKPFLIKMLEDITSVKLDLEGISPIKVSNTKVLNAYVAKSSYFQYALVSLANMCIRILQTMQNRQTTTYHEFANMMIENLIKLIEDQPAPDSKTYTFNIKTSLVALLILKHIIRPRNEEQFQVIKKFEARILFETQNLDQEFTTSYDEEDLNQQVDQKERQLVLRQLLLILAELLQRDQQNVGIARRINESKIANNILTVLKYNTEEQGHLCDDFLSKYFALIGQICSDNPAITPNLIKNGVIGGIIDSIKQRIPKSPDSIETLIFTINQMSLQEEGQKLIWESDIFRTLISKVTDEKLFSTLNGEQMGMKMHLNNLFDRKPAFRDIAKESLIAFLDQLKQYAIEQTIKYFEILRQEDLSRKQKQEEIQKQIRKQVQYTQMQGIIILAITLANLSNDRAQQSRHTIEIFNADVFNKLLQVYEIIGYNPALNEMNTCMQKGLKSLIEHQSFAGNVQSFQDRFLKHVEKLQNIINCPIYQLKDFDFNDKTPIKEALQDIQLLDPENLDDFLMRGERLIAQISQVNAFSKLHMYLHSATQHQMIQNPITHKIAKPIFYLIRVIQRIKSKCMHSIYQEITEKVDSDVYNKYGKVFELSYKDYASLPVEENKETHFKIKEFCQIVVQERYVDEMPPELAIKEQTFQDFLSKISNFSFHQMRHQQQREALEKNLLFIGKLMAKTTKQFNKMRLSQIHAEIASPEFMRNFYLVNLQINDIMTGMIKGQIDGASFYSFFKNKGLHNVIDCFHWLSGLKITEDTPAPIVVIYDDTCRLVKEFLITIITSRNSENHLNSILQCNMGTDFDSPKHLYQNVYYSLANELLQLSIPDQQQNSIVKVTNPRNSYLLDVIMSLLQNASKSFQNCQMLKESQSQRDQRDARRGNRGQQADPSHIQTLLDMNMGFSRDRIVQALLQSNNNLDNAVNLLLEWLAQENLGIQDAPDQNLDDGASSDDSHGENLLLLDQIMQSSLGEKEFLKESRQRRLQKVGEEAYNEILKRTQQEGFKWMIEAQKSDDNQSPKFREYLITVMLSEKNETIQKQMFAQIDEIFKRNLDQVLDTISNLSQQQSQQEDQQMEDLTSKNKEYSKIFKKFSGDFMLYQKLVNNNKVYLKEVLKSDVYNKTFQALKKLLKQFTQRNERFTTLQSSINSVSKRLIYDMLFLLFSMIQLMQLQVSSYAAQKVHVDAYQKKIQVFRTRVMTKPLFDTCIEILNFCKDSFEKEKHFPISISLINTFLAVSVRILIDKDLDKSFRDKGVEDLLQIIFQIHVGQKFLSTLLILTFENDQILHGQIEKLTQKVLWLKYENDKKGNKQASPNQKQEHTIEECNANFNDFLKYFQQLSSRNQDIFKKVLGEQCELKSQKKLGQISQDLAQIRLKESVFNDLSKSQQSERNQFKLILKQINFKNDKQAKNFSKTSKSLLQSQIPENKRQIFNCLIQALAEREKQESDDLNNYFAAQNQYQTYQKDVVDKQMIKADRATIETLFKICQAYPSFSALLLQSQPLPKKSFVSWFIKDYLLLEMFEKKFDKQPNEDKVELSYSLKNDLKALDSFVIKALNNLTGYNHLMNLNEQIVKHELRTKFVLEALSILQKSLKDKQQHQLKQKGLIIICLMIINALVNFNNFNPSKQQVVSQDNFYNSIRVCVVRDAANKDQNLPNSFIKIANDLLTEVIDVSLASNVAIINKCVNILKVFSEFIQNEKKKEENDKIYKDLQERQPNEEVKQQVENDQNIQQRQQQEDQPMAQALSEDSDDQNMHEDDAQADENQEEDDYNEEDEDEEADEIFEANEDEEMGDEIELHRQDEDHDLFEEEEEDDLDDQINEDEMMFQDGIMGQEVREPRVLDIINPYRGQIGIPEIHGNHQFGMHQQDQRRQDWSVEEDQVQRILTNMRRVQDQIASNQGGIQAPAGYGMPQRDAAIKKGIIEQIFEGLKVLSEKEIFQIVVDQRQFIDLESKELGSQLNIDLLQPLAAMARPRINMFDGRMGDEDEIIHDFEFIIGGQRLQDRPFGGVDRFGGLQAILGNLGQPGIGGAMPHFLDPMFIRPDPRYPEGQGLLMAPPPINQLDQPDFGAYNISLRQHAQQTQQNQSDALGQQLIEALQVQVVEEKQPEPVALPKEQVKEPSSPKLVPNLSNQQLIQDFILSSGNEINDEMTRMIERSRQLNEEINRNRQDIQAIVSSQQRPGEQQPHSQEQQQQQDEQQMQVDQVQQPSDQQQQQQQVQVQNQVSQKNPPEDVPSEEEDVSAFEEAQSVQIQQVQEVNQVKVEEEKKEEQKQEASSSSGKTFGYDNELLLANGIDPDILHELPEELRIELLSTIDVQQMQVNAQYEEEKKESEQNQQQNQQQPNQSSQQQQQQQQQENLPEYYAIAQELGLDPEFLANLPEDMRMELIVQAQQQQIPPQREPEPMDLASFIATVTDPALRREIFMNMDEGTIATLPPQLMAEARQVQDHIRNERVRARDHLEQMDRRVRGLMEQLDPAMRQRDEFDALGSIFGRRYQQQREEQKKNISGKGLEESIAARQNQISNEFSNEDTLHSLSQQLLSDEKILESLLQILLTNERAECELIPTLNSLIKIQNQNGIPVLRNKLINAITFILKSISQSDDDALKMLFPNAQLKHKQAILILIGSLRLLLKTNKNLMKYVLKGLIVKEDQATHLAKSTQILKKQMKAMTLKSPTNVEMQSVDESQSDQMQKKTSVNIAPPLVEIFSLIKSDMFKKDKALIKNLTLLIQQILKQIDYAIEELENSSLVISQETIQSIAEVLSLENIEKDLMEVLGNFLFQISKRKKVNFELISVYCKGRCTGLLDKLNEKLVYFAQVFESIKCNVSPNKMLGLMESPSPSQSSAFEEEKHSDVIMIDTSAQANQAKNQSIKLPDEEEKKLKQHLKIKEESQILLRIFKLFNLFFDNYSTIVHENKEVDQEQINTETNPLEVIGFVKQTYQQNDMLTFVQQVSDALRIALKTNIEMTDGVSNLIFCVFASFYPELFEAIQHENESNKREDAGSKDKKDEAKYKVKMLPLTDASIKQEKFTLFRTSSYFNNRIEELNQFCIVNKRIINKLIKSKPKAFEGEIDALIKHIPNLLDFDNKRAYFKKELLKLKKSNHHYNQIDLFIRRDDIFMDSYAQLGIKSAEEMKGRLHIQFTGERGQDAGGLTRDFFIELSREMFNPNYSLFNLSSSGSTYYPNPKSYVERDHLKYFKFIGRVIGKALFEECLLECYFVKSFYKIMTGEPLTFQDLEDFDNEFFNNLKWCLENDIEPLQTTFAIETDFFGKTEEVELIEGGKNIPVTNQNKHQYLEKFTYFKLYKQIQKQVDSFLEGFYELLGKDLIGIFNYKELELLISGLPNFDINDLKNNTEYSGYQANSPIVQWLWEVLESFDNSERAEFLQFVTGSSKIPLDGFKGLMGMRGPQKFQIAKIKTDDIMRLPSGHTCFNQIDLPEYPSKEILHERLLTAIKETKGFGFA